MSIPSRWRSFANDHSGSEGAKQVADRGIFRRRQITFGTLAKMRFSAGVVIAGAKTDYQKRFFILVIP